MGEGKPNHNALNWIIRDINRNIYIEASRFLLVAGRNLIAGRSTGIYISSNCYSDNMATVVEVRKKLLLALRKIELYEHVLL